ncbi:hypothetical protein E1A91_D11G008000v1 [Gossypium mustelinum]|uniref:Uncharacterized protein n=3 Tax=Gossypium TaxID=3633 RepID=A0A5D2SKR9_GOSMU|nr:hypothetical protein ES288_D11G008500v1 [Gossypium darwinii]TYH41652.1 hypothetical protein ES332_D11G008100v1 [Gossypium tomentosum]TYI53491.1 hypothetical protein E1A91_D11G008000v1 [Gossypium mustelinum]
MDIFFHNGCFLLLWFFLVSERPVLYSRISDSAWRNFRLPHQMMSPANNTGPSSGSQMDFLAELRRAIRNGNTDN